MKMRQRVYAMVMVTVYVVATLLSSLSLLTCNHHHHHHEHHIEQHSAACACRGVVLQAECCDHHHPIFGENHTEYINSELRSDSRIAQAISIMLAPAVTNVMVGELSVDCRYVCKLEYVDKSERLLTTFVPRETLRAPPVMV